MDGMAMCPVKDKEMELGRRESERPYVHYISVYMAAPTHETHTHTHTKIIIRKENRNRKKKTKKIVIK